jgi:hypothetical protein
MATAILSKLLSLLNDSNTVDSIISSIERKFNKIPIFYSQSVIDEDYIANMEQIISPEEVQLFSIDNYPF